MNKQLREIRGLKSGHFPPLCCQYKSLKATVCFLANQLEKSKEIPAMGKTSKEMEEVLVVVTTDTPESGEEVWNVQIQLANVLTLAVRAGPRALLGQNGKVHQCPDSLDFSRSDQTKVTAWLAQLWMGNQYKPVNCHNKQFKMYDILNWKQGVGEMLLQVQGNGMIGIGNLPEHKQLVELAFGCPVQAATVECKIHEIITRTVSSLSNMLSSKF